METVSITCIEFDMYIHFPILIECHYNDHFQKYWNAALLELIQVCRTKWLYSSKILNISTKFGLKVPSRLELQTAKHGVCSFHQVWEISVNVFGCVMLRPPKLRLSNPKVHQDLSFKKASSMLRVVPLSDLSFS